MKRKVKYFLVLLLIIMVIASIILVLHMNKEFEKVYNADGTAYIIDKLSPDGFAGSSLNEVILYSNKEAYLVTYDGNNNINSERLIAKNIDSLEKKSDGGIKIVGNEVIVVDISTEWIEIVDKNNWKIVYRLKLEEIKDDLVSTDEVSYYLEDMDSDEIPELIVKKNDEYLYYSFKDNSLSETEGFNGKINVEKHDINDIDF